MNPSNADLSPRSRWSGRRVPIAALVVAAATSALLAAGCGGGSSGAGVAQLGTTTSTSDSSSSGGSGKGDPAAFSACMRKNGVPNFPDPDRSGHFRITGGQDKSGRKFGVDTNSPQFSKARQACRRLEPNGGKPDPQEEARMQQQALKFSQCMRAHGVPKFPDPQFQSGGGTLMKIGKDVNPDSRQFQAAQKACQKLLPGAVQGAPPGEKP